MIHYTFVAYGAIELIECLTAYEWVESFMRSVVVVLVFGVVVVAVVARELLFLL